MICRDEVVCDFCNTDFTDSKEVGGLIHNKSWAVCPGCALDCKTRVTSRANDGETFKDFVNRIRRGQGWLVV